LRQETKISFTTHDNEKTSDGGTPVGTLRGKVDVTGEDGKPLDKDAGRRNVQFNDEQPLANEFSTH
jgi:hypothetical protein